MKRGIHRSLKSHCLNRPLLGKGPHSLVCLLQNWGRSNLSRAVSAGVVDGPVLKLEPVVRSRSMVSLIFPCVINNELLNTLVPLQSWPSYGCRNHIMWESPV